MFCKLCILSLLGFPRLLCTLCCAQCSQVASIDFHKAYLQNTAALSQKKPENRLQCDVMKLSLSGMTPFVIGEFVNSLFPCVDRDVISTWRAFVGSFVKAHAMTILSYTRFSLLLRLVRPLLFIHTPVHNNSFHSPTVSLKLHCEHSEQIKRNKRLFHGSKPGGFCVVLIERIDCSLTKRNTLVLLIDYISAVVFKVFL